MLDIKFIRENSEVMEKTINDRFMGNGEQIIEDVLNVDKRVQGLLKKLELKRSLRNKLTEDVAKITDVTEKKKLIEEATIIKEEIKKLEEEYTKEKEIFDELLSKLPNLIAVDVPFGKDESQNVSVKKHGEPAKFDFTAKDHLELGLALDLIDVEKAAEISGSRFYYLKNELVLLQFALVQLTMHTLTNPKIIGGLADSVGNPFKNTFVPIVPPVLMRPEIMKKMGRLDPVEERYYIPSDPLVLVGSAEHTLGPLHMNQILDYEKLPIRYIGYSTAFRREAGSYGKDIKGIFRAHQFDKLEMETFAPIEYGEAEQALLVAIQEYLVQKLEIPYEVMDVCTGDMGKPDYKQIDINCYLPGQGKYRETHSADYMTDFQSRRLNAMYKTKSGEKKYLYMNDATALAIGRTLIAILENYQQKDGSVKIPKVLLLYMNGIEEIKPKK